MELITKEDVLMAFQNKMKGRNWLLYQYYKESMFTIKFPRYFIAEKISKDLNYPIQIETIRNIFRFIIQTNKDCMIARRSTLDSTNPDGKKRRVSVNEQQKTNLESTPAGREKSHTGQSKNNSRIDISDILSKYNITNGDEDPRYDPIPDL